MCKSKYFLFFLLFICINHITYSIEIDRRIPDEYEYALKSACLVSGGTALINNASAVKINPSMIATDIKYTITGAYNFSSFGRDFIQIGIVDSKTSPVAAGILYTGFLDKYNKSAYNFIKKEKDSTINQRFLIAFAQKFKSFTIGIGGQYLEAWEFQNTTQEKTKIKGISFNFGLSILISPIIRYAASIENFSNKKIQNYAPQVFRTGISSVIFRDSIIVNLDYKIRQRVKNQEYMFDNLAQYNLSENEINQIQQDDNKYTTSEQSFIGSSNIKIYDMFNVLISYAIETSSIKRTQLGTGIEVVNKNSSLFYNIVKPYLNKPETFQNIGLSLNINW